MTTVAPVIEHLAPDEAPWDVREPEPLPPRDLLDDQLGALSFLMSSAGEPEAFRSLSDEGLLQLVGVLSAQERFVRAQSALAAGEIARRSRPELGFSGLAQSRGHRTPDELVRVATGSSLGDAKRAVSIGTLVVEQSEADRAPVPAADPVTGEVLEQTPPTPSVPWLAGVARAVAEGALSVEKADAIRRGLGEPDRVTGDADRDAGRVTIETLALAADRLLAEAAALDADRLLRRARELRDEFDEAGVATRERRRREMRSFRAFRQADGMTRAIWLMDPETAAVVTEIADRATSPKLGGPRFVDPDDISRAEEIARDPRTPEQYASDTMLALLRAGAEADPGALPGEGTPAVRVIVARRDLAARAGVAHLEGQQAPVSIATAERHVCTAGTRDIVFDPAGRPLDVGRDRRLFTRAQRIALAVRDGGCRFPGCDRPPSWCEAHHIRHWVRDRGGTDIDDGILLCRHHHLLVHDAGWEIEHDHGVNYRLIPPASRDPEQRPVPMPTKSAAYRRLMARSG